MILPIMDYADIFCHNKSLKLLHKYQTIQNRCVRLISRIPRLSSTDEESKNLGLIPIANRRALHILQFTCELSLNQPELTITLNDNLRRVTLTRSHDPSRIQFKLFKPNKSLVLNSISYMLRSRWNALPTAAHAAQDKHTLASLLLANPSLITF